jgi:hypothetical protein
MSDKEALTAGAGLLAMLEQGILFDAQSFQAERNTFLMNTIPSLRPLLLLMCFSASFVSFSRRQQTFPS